MKREAMDLIKSIEEQIKAGDTNRTIPLNENIFNIVTEYGNLDTMKWLHEAGCPWSKGGMTFYLAALKGNFEKMKWLHENGCPVPVFTLNEFRKYEDYDKSYEIQKWLYSQDLLHLSDSESNSGILKNLNKARAIKNKLHR